MENCSPIKVGENNESIFNNIIYSIVKIIVPLLRELNLSPNDLTTISIFFAYLSYRRLLEKDLMCIFYYTIYMILDYADGYMARMYKLQSSFGDVYDHLRDTIFHIFLANIFYKDKKLFVLFIISVILSLNSFGCQEVIHEAECEDNYNDTIGWLKPLCKDNPSLTKFNEILGSGIVYLGTMICMYLYCLDYLRK